ncbi:MAG: WbqC family protein [Mariprofundales bacterium]|nr:WbqC family protein [Mariprofundales bacterium]
MQFHKGDWQNRNRIKTHDGARWLTTPVNYSFGQKITDITISGGNWVRKQISTICQSYDSAPFFADYWTPLAKTLRQAESERWSLNQLNITVIRLLGEQLGCSSPCLVASEMEPTSDDPTQRLIDLCKQQGGDGYLSGAEGRNYLRQEEFARQGLTLCFQQVEAPIYPQLHGEFISHLSVIDLLYNTGPAAEGIIYSMGGVVDG